MNYNTPLLMEFGFPGSVLDPQVMNPNPKTLSKQHQSAKMVRYQSNESSFSASWDFQAGHLPFPLPPGLILKRCPWIQCSQPHQQTLNLPELKKAAGRQAGEILPATASHWNSSHTSWVDQEGCSAPPLLQTCRDLGQEKGFGWFPFPTQRKAEQGCLPGRTRK